MTTAGPGPVAQRLFFTDFAGQPAEPEDVVADGLDGGWAEREPEAVALLRDPAADPYDRFLACSTLSAWGSPDGYRAVIDGCDDPAAAPWRGQSADRRSGVDDTFALLAQDVGRSVDMAAERGTSALRTEAQAALLGVADRVFLDRGLVQGMYEADVRTLTPDLVAAIEAGCVRLSAPDRPEFDLGAQVAGLIRTLARVDPEGARTWAGRLLALHPSARAVAELGDLAPTT